MEKGAGRLFVPAPLPFAELSAISPMSSFIPPRYGRFGGWIYWGLSFSVALWPETLSFGVNNIYNLEDISSFLLKSDKFIGT